uniref:Uncharacterized protein n=1 Tax=Corvus moneduloides TaxID=1196302 RepID=A0A8C3DI55_CORMO
GPTEPLVPMWTLPCPQGLMGHMEPLAPAECLSIVPRCMWGARPCWGTLFCPCACAMRDRQSFHQDTRTWDNIGPCSFVVGSDGYLYEGRGWCWVGAHTKYYSTKGLGIGIIWDFSATLLDPDALALVQDELLPCVVHSGLVWPDFTPCAHRQLSHANCPGNALFQEIQSWPSFQGLGWVSQ